MSELLQEFCDSRGVSVQVDRAASLIRGVKILGFESRNARRYLPDALAAAIPLYEGAKVNVNHPRQAPPAARDYRDRLGSIRRVVLRPGEGLFADLKFNPKHALAEQLIWDAEHAPENVGFSHNVQARTSRRAEQVVVEEILAVHSVDLVADPATTQGLFEAAADAGDDAQPAAQGAAKSVPSGGIAAVETPQAELIRLREEIRRLREEADLQRRGELIRTILAEFQLPLPQNARGPDAAIVSPVFLEQLQHAEGSAAMRRLVADRARLVAELSAGGSAPWAGERPRSREQRLVEPQPEPCGDVESWVATIT